MLSLVAEHFMHPLQVFVACLVSLSSISIAFVRVLSLGGKLRKDLRKDLKIRECKKCHVCRGLFDGIDIVNKMVLKSVSEYEFKTFLLGVTMRPSVVDGDDFIRSKFHLIGAESVKSAFAHDLSKALSHTTKTKSQILSPDISLTVNLRKDSVYARSTPAYISGRYLKEKRGMPQKLVKCYECNGVGCIKCSATRESIEMNIAEYLCSIFAAESAKITWVGGEDKSSLVLGNGRPFFAQMINPKKRKPRMPKHQDLGQGLNLLCPKNIKSYPKMPVKFRSIIKVSVQTKDEISAAGLKQIKEMQGSSIAVYEKSRRNEKMVYSVRYKKSSPKSLAVTLQVDGGLPIKKFIGGDTVFPNLTDMLETECTCEYFDFYGVDVTA